MDRAFSMVHHIASFPINSYSPCLITLIYLWVFPIIGYCVKWKKELSSQPMPLDMAKTCFAHAFPHQSRVSNEWRSYSRSLFLLVRNLESRINCSTLGPRKLTQNFIHWILQLNLACWIWGGWKYFSWIFFSLKIKVKMICWKFKKCIIQR